MVNCKVQKYWQYASIASIPLILTSMLTLTHIRMYGHDTRGWMIPVRVWFVDTLRQGDIPLWFPLVRYGFPTTVGQFSAAIWSPVALAMALFGDYGPTSVAYEFLVWRIVALLGAWWFARTHVGPGVLAWVVGCTFVVVGSFASQEILHYVFFGMSVVPWIIGAVDRCVRGPSWRERYLGVGVLGLSGAMLLWSGYPGIWLMLPIYLMPYVSISIWMNKNNNYFNTNIFIYYFSY